MTLFIPGNLLLMHFIQDIQGLMNPFCAKTLKLTVMWCHMETMALRGVSGNDGYWGIFLRFNLCLLAQSELLVLECISHTVKLTNIEKTYVSMQPGPHLTTLQQLRNK